MIDERYERIISTRRRIERVCVRIVAALAVLLAIASIAASLMPGYETWDGTTLIESSRAGGGDTIALAAITLLACAASWYWPRPRTLVLAGFSMWFVGVVALVISISRYHGPYGPQAPTNYRYVEHYAATRACDMLLGSLFILWFAIPLVTFAYAIVCAIADDVQKRKLPDAPEFPTARVERG